MANGPSKDVGRAKCSSNFTDLAVSFFAVMCVNFPREVVSRSLKAKKISKYRVRFFFVNDVIVIETKHLELAFRTL